MIDPQYEYVAMRAARTVHSQVSGFPAEAIGFSVEVGRVVVVCSCGWIVASPDALALHEAHVTEFVQAITRAAREGT